LQASSEPNDRSNKIPELLYKRTTWPENAQHSVPIASGKYTCRYGINWFC